MKLSKIIFIIAIFIFTANSVQAKKITPKRETVEWIDVWLPHTNDDKLPRVLLIGNSITRGYYPKVEKLLKGKAYVARLTTSKSLGDPALIQEINLIMSYGKFDLVHFNNGLHGWEYTEDEYDQGYSQKCTECETDLGYNHTYTHREILRTARRKSSSHCYQK